ncbi:MAG: hypothetical protein Q8O23_04180 [Gallionella sp.]|nr:hypothetical protein [Gallionella sp.]
MRQNPAALPRRPPRTTGATPVQSEPLLSLRSPPQRGTAQASKLPLACLRRARGYGVADCPQTRYARLLPRHPAAIRPRLLARPAGRGQAAPGEGSPCRQH